MKLMHRITRALFRKPKLPQPGDVLTVADDHAIALRPADWSEAAATTGPLTLVVMEAVCPDSPGWFNVIAGIHESDPQVYFYWVLNKGKLFTVDLCDDEILNGAVSKSDEESGKHKNWRSKL